jgi:regulator of replication initiation timing
MDVDFQLELNLEDMNGEDMKLHHMQKQLDAMNESMGKVRRKLFSELTEMKKLLGLMCQENESLKISVHNLKQEKQEWIYGHDDFLFKTAI